MPDYVYSPSRCMSLWTPWPCWVFEDTLKVAPAGWTMEHLATGVYRITPREGDIENTEYTVATANLQWYDKEYQKKAVLPAFDNRLFIVAVYPACYEVHSWDAMQAPVDANFSLLILSPG